MLVFVYQNTECNIPEVNLKLHSVFTSFCCTVSCIHTYVQILYPIYSYQMTPNYIAEVCIMKRKEDARSCKDGRHAV
jgi:hypothetical protein